MVFSSLGASVALLLALQKTARAQLDRTGWTVTVDSAQDSNPANNVLDGDTTTFWHTQWNPTTDPLPHYIIIDMKATQTINALTYLPRQDGNQNGNIGDYAIDLSTDGNNWGEPVATGKWIDDDQLKKANFASQNAQYVRLRALSEVENTGDWTSAAEINILPPADPTKGIWSAPFAVPLVPAAAAIIPKTGQVLMWSAQWADHFVGTGNTQTAIFDPATKEVSELTVSNTGHDMFCPGISLDANGEVVVTGGNDAAKTSIYNDDSGSWTAAPEMNIWRGYQSQATLSNGNIFTIGGSWSGGNNGGAKNGEVFDGTNWRNLDGCISSAMLTQDQDSPADNPNWRRDNHGWLFGWKDGSVFQAGPSKNMNWYQTTSDTGSQSPAGTRGDDSDAMNGNAIMYDAAAGKILIVGGAPNYEDKTGMANGYTTEATKNAHIISISIDAANAVSVEAIDSMEYQRAFANSVVLPDGSVLVTGGQVRPRPFSDAASILAPELWDPLTKLFTTLNPMSIPRNYHSTALLLPDATVFNGGGGLCPTLPCVTDHLDAEIFSPPYLFQADGTPAPRPTIVSVSTASIVVGGELTVVTDADVASFALVRMASSTHSVNTDQRRIPLLPAEGGSAAGGYRLRIPSDAGVALPGYWMLFALSEEGVPSLAETVQIRTA